VGEFTTQGFLQTTFKNWGILPFYSQYIFSLMMFVVKYMYLYATNQEIHGIRLTAFKEGAYFTGMKIFNHLSTNVKQQANKIELFKSA
jgi:hypothetical protein